MLPGHALTAPSTARGLRCTGRHRIGLVAREGASFVEHRPGDAGEFVGQLDLQALHRVRERFVSQRTGIINQIRAFLLERGVAIRQGLRFLRVELPSILATRTDVLAPRMTAWSRI